MCELGPRSSPNGRGPFLYRWSRMLRIISIAKSRPSDTGSDDDYDVFNGGGHVGRIVRRYAAPRDRPWVWSITCRFPQSPQDRGDAAGLEAAMAESKARWEATTLNGPMSSLTAQNGHRSCIATMPASHPTRALSCPRGILRKGH